jgi:hypothetical protein
MNRKSLYNNLTNQVFEIMQSPTISAFQFSGITVSISKSKSLHKTAFQFSEPISRHSLIEELINSEINRSRQKQTRGLKRIALKHIHKPSFARIRYNIDPIFKNASNVTYIIIVLFDTNNTIYNGVHESHKPCGIKVGQTSGKLEKRLVRLVNDYKLLDFVIVGVASCPLEGVVNLEKKAHQCIKSHALQIGIKSNKKVTFPREFFRYSTSVIIQLYTFFENYNRRWVPFKVLNDIENIIDDSFLILEDKTSLSSYYIKNYRTI